MQQIVSGCKNNALAFGRADTGPCTTKGAAGTAAHLYKYQGAIAVTHDQVNFAATAPRRPIIAHYQFEPRSLQVDQSLVLCGNTPVAGRDLAAGGRIGRPVEGRSGRFFLSKEVH